MLQLVTKGISLFIVPKNRPNDTESLDFNDVNTIGDFQKMGQKGYCTSHLSFGDNNDCRAWLVGEENKGLYYMFLMMNAAGLLLEEEHQQLQQLHIMLH